MHSIWTGSISFGLVNIPVNLFSASEERELTFHMLHKTDHSPVRFARLCAADGEEVPYQDIVKGFEYTKGEFVVLDDEDFHRANVRKSKSIDIFEFVREDEIDPLYFEKPYYIEPKNSGKAYLILREALKRTGRVGLAKFVLQHKEHLGIVRASGDRLMLIQLRFKDEVRTAPKLDIPEGKKVTEKEIHVATRLIDQETEHFHPGRYHDAYSAELKELIEKKAHGKKIKVSGKAPVETKTKDLMSMLEKSLRKAPQRHVRSAPRVRHSR